MFEYKNTRFHLVARTKENKDVVLFEFNEDYNFYYYMSQVDPEIYKEADIIERLGYDYPISRMPCEFKDNTPYFKRKELKNERTKR